MKHLPMRHSMKKVLWCLSSAIAISQLSACAPLVISGAAVASKVVIDRRTAGIQVEDEAIELRSESGLKKILPKNSHVKVSSYNRMVLLTGEVNSDNDRTLAERFVKSQDNVKTVINDLVIAPETTLTQRAKDQLISAEIKTRLIASKDIHASAVHIVTQNGVVYLMGRLTNSEADRVSNLASTSQISGIQKVVKVFEIISEEDLRRMVATPLR